MNYVRKPNQGLISLVHGPIDRPIVTRFRKGNPKITDGQIPRVVESHIGTELFTMAHMIASTPHPVDKVDAIAVMPGLGEHIRIITAVNAWESNPQTRHLLIAGTNPTEHTQIQPTLEFLQGNPIYLQRTDGVETQINAKHTREQAEWLMERVRALNIRSMALFVSHWHLPRAYSTLIKTMLEDGDNYRPIPVFPVSVVTSPNAITPETKASVTAMSAGEAERIRKYQELGYVVTLDELHAYLGWLWEQDIVPINEYLNRRLSI